MFVCLSKLRVQLHVCFGTSYFMCCIVVLTIVLFYHNDPCELQLVLPDGVDSLPADVSVMWTGNGINHPY